MTLFVEKKTNLARNLDLNIVPLLKLYNDQLLFANQTSLANPNKRIKNDKKEEKQVQ